MNNRAPILTLAFLLAFTLLAPGCGAVKTAVQFGKLETNLKPWDGNALFFPEIKSNKFALRIANSAAYDFTNEVQAQVETTLRSRGYDIVDVDGADYVILLKLSSKEQSRSAGELYGSSSSPEVTASGAMLGAVAGSDMSGGGLEGMAIGAGIGAVSAMGLSDLGDSWVKLDRVEIYGQMLILERTNQAITAESSTKFTQGADTTQRMDYAETTHWKQYKQWFTVSAQKAGLKWDEARPHMIQLVAKGTTDSFQAF